MKLKAFKVKHYEEYRTKFLLFLVVTNLTEMKQYLKIFSTNSEIPQVLCVVKRTLLNDNLLMILEHLFTLAILYPYLHVLSLYVQLAITTKPILFSITPLLDHDPHLAIPQLRRLPRDSGTAAA